MASKLCPVCDVRGGINHMKGEVTQVYDITNEQPQITEWSCPYCGHKETETLSFDTVGGTHNSGVAQGPQA